MATRYVDVDADAGGNGTTTALTGANCAYKSLSIWEAARQADLPPGDIIEQAVCQSTHANHTADTTVLTIDGWTTDATRYIDIQAATASRAGTALSATKYRHIPNDGYAYVFTVSESYVRVTGLQLAANDGTSAPVKIAPGTTTSSVLFDSCLIYKSGYQGINAYDGTCEIRNCIIYGASTSSSNIEVGWTGSARTATVTNCTLIGAKYGVKQGDVGGTYLVKNTYAGGAATSDFFADGTAPTYTTCASSDATDRTGVTKSIAVSTSAGAYFTNITAGSEDFSIGASSALLNVGTDLSATFTTDIVGTTRPTGAGTWDIGAFEYVAAAVFAFLPLFRRLTNTLLRR